MLPPPLPLAPAPDPALASPCFASDLAPGSILDASTGQTLKPNRLRAPLRVSACPAVDCFVCAGAVAAILGLV